MRVYPGAERGEFVPDEEMHAFFAQRKVRYTPQAKADLSEIFSFAAKDNPAAASKLIARIRHHVVALSNNPALGRAGRIAGTRELIIPRYPYIAAYRIHGDAVEVLAIVHTSRSWPEVF